MTFCVIASCKKNDGTFADEKTIRISYVVQAYGDKWLIEGIKAFNNVYEKQGWHAVLERDDPNCSDKCYNEVRNYADNNYDLYIDITNNNINDIMDASYPVLKVRNKYLLENLESLYDQHPLDLNGKEEPETIRENSQKTTLNACSYYGIASPNAYGQLYGLQWCSGYAGMVINKDAFTTYGYEIPRTTKELKALCDKVLVDNKTNTYGSKVYPITWAGVNASGFMSYCFEAWLGQWLGLQGFEDFYALNPADGDTKTKGYEVYDNVGIQYALQACDEFIDLNYACNGTLSTIDHATSVQILADAEALIAITGDYAYNACRTSGYSDEELNCLSLMKMPLLSELADKFNLPGSNADEKDQCLSLIAKYIDEGKTNEQIVQLVNNVTAEQVTNVRDARGIYFDHGTTHVAYIPEYANAKEGAKLFLRFIASKDFAQNIFAPYAGGATANKNANITGNAMCDALTAITKCDNAIPVAYEEYLSKIRMSGAIGFIFEPATSWPDMMKSFAIGTYDPVSLYTSIKNGMKTNWNSIIIVSGLYDEE